MASVQETTCCGLGEVFDVGSSSKARILQAVASAKRMHMGMVFATTTNRQRGAVQKMRSAGFKTVRRFKNPNTGHWINLWMMPTSAIKDPPKPPMPTRPGTYAYESVDSGAETFWEWRAPEGERFVTAWNPGVAISKGRWVFVNYDD